MFVTKDEALRRTLEDKIADEFPNTTPSYRVLKSSDMADTVGIEKRLALGIRRRHRDARRHGRRAHHVYARHVLVWRAVLHVQQLLGHGVGISVRPRICLRESNRDDRTQIYSLANDKLIWAGRSETTDPRTAGRLAHSVVGRVVRALKKDGPPRADVLLRDPSVQRLGVGPRGSLADVIGGLAAALLLVAAARARSQQTDTATPARPENETSSIRDGCRSGSARRWSSMRARSDRIARATFRSGMSPTSAVSVSPRRSSWRHQLRAAMGLPVSIDASDCTPIAARPHRKRPGADHSDSGATGTSPSGDRRRASRSR